MKIKKKKEKKGLIDVDSFCKREKTSVLGIFNI